MPLPASPSPSTSTPVAAVTPAQPEKFIRLPGRATTLRLRAQGSVLLYLADTYLLQVQVLRLRESYLRFAYKDIQAIAICRTTRGVAYSVTLLVVAILFLLGVLATGEPEAKYTLAAFAGVTAVLLAVELLRGTTCRCVVQTATGKHPLLSLVRMKPTRRALAMITERIAAAQGTLDQATASQQMETFLLNHSSPHLQRTVAAQAAAATANAPAPGSFAPTPQEPASY